MTAEGPKDPPQHDLERLHPVYARGLRLRAAGLSEPAIAAELQIEPEALPLLFALAEAKLASLRASHEPEAGDAAPIG